jgi:hypothetical protein
VVQLRYCKLFHDFIPVLWLDPKQRDKKSLEEGGYALVAVEWTIDSNPECGVLIHV